MKATKLEIALAALKDIASPMVKLHAEAAARGARVDGVAAVLIVQDAQWLREKARTALNRVKRAPR